MRIYVCSKTYHAPMWRQLRDELALGSAGHRIISTWIDEVEPGETKDRADLARRCIDEASTADRLIIYRELGDLLKGGFIEIGAALASKVEVVYVGPNDLGSVFSWHPLWRSVSMVSQAIALPMLRPADERGGITQLHELATRLVRLTEDPHPGLSTWCGFVDEVLTNISKFR